MKRIRSILGAAALLLAVAGCEAASTLLVTTGHLAGHEETTIGDAFNASFSEPTWRSFETEKGATVVEFTGKNPSDLFLAGTGDVISDPRNAAVRLPAGGLVRFQFLIKGDKFSISYVEAECSEWNLCVETKETCDRELAEAQRDGRSLIPGKAWWLKPRLEQVHQAAIQGILNGRIYGDPVL